MSANPQKNTLEREPVEKIKRLERKIDQIVSNLTNFLIIPKLTSDPTNPQNAQIWYNTTSNTFKCRQNGVTKTFTVS